MENMVNIQTSPVLSCNSDDLQSVHLSSVDEKRFKTKQTYWWNTFDLSFCCCICCMDDDDD